MIVRKNPIINEEKYIPNTTSGIKPCQGEGLIPTCLQNEENKGNEPNKIRRGTTITSKNPITIHSLKRHNSHKCEEFCFSLVWKTNYIQKCDF